MMGPPGNCHTLRPLLPSTTSLAPLAYSSVRVLGAESASCHTPLRSCWASAGGDTFAALENSTGVAGWMKRMPSRSISSPI